MKEQLLERFLRYVRIYTPSDDSSGTTPSTKYQFDLANVLAEEMSKMGISDVYVDEHCYVYGNIPSSAGLENVPAIAFIAHMDTVSDFCDKATVPVVHYDYDGEDIFLEAGQRTIRTADFPHLKDMNGRTIITSDGTTILGADDKAGIAEIMTLAQEITDTGIPHGKICIAFTPDEEIGGGAGLLDLTPAELALRVLSLNAFHRISQDDYRILLRHLLETDHVNRTENGGLIVGLTGERIVNNYKFYAVFQENVSLRWVFSHF